MSEPAWRDQMQDTSARILGLFAIPVIVVSFFVDLFMFQLFCFNFQANPRAASRCTRPVCTSSLDPLAQKPAVQALEQTMFS